MTLPSKKTKDARIAFRVQPELKTRFEEAAQLSEATLSEFCISAIRRAADEKLRSAQSIRLRGRDAAVFFEALTNPPAPNAALIRAARDHRERVEGD